MNCVQYDSVYVEACPLPLVDIPNAMTINGDGANETFFIDKIRFYPNNTLKIYNRWGSLIYKAHGYNNDWDGTRNGSPMPVGTYYYVLDLGDDSKSNYQGYITLIRP